MRALDLFCCGGGASKGLADAGFEVLGVDIEEQPDYPFAFELADALTFPLDGFDFLWASPPCQHFTAYRRRPGHVKPCVNLIPEIRARFQEHHRKTGVPYVIENVEGAPLENPVTLCGSMFGLDVRRHRLFETSFPVTPPSCRHKEQTPRFAPASNRKNLRSTVEVGVWRIPLEVQQKAMGIDWLPLHHLSQAIPPAYSKFLARSCPRRHHLDRIVQPGCCTSCFHPNTRHLADRGGCMSCACSRVDCCQKSVG